MPPGSRSSLYEDPIEERWGPTIEEEGMSQCMLPLEFSISLGLVKAATWYKIDVTSLFADGSSMDDAVSLRLTSK
jgi:hypothetical protein